MPSHIFLDDAVSDILVDQRYEGAIDSISWLTDIVDGGFMMYITFIAFFIISVALLRNVLAACYIAFPKFWDKVAQAHEDKKETAYFERMTGFFKSGWKETSNSSIANFILGIIPNVKCWTDFADGNSDDLAVKDYIIKAVPQMILVVGIGVFIYNGYYRDTAAKITAAGSEVFERFVTSVDPVETVDKLLATTGTPDFSTDNALTKKDKLHNDICHQIYAAIISKYNDIDDATAKTNLAASIESVVNKWFEEDAEFTACAEDKNYKSTSNTSIGKASFSSTGLQASDDPNIKAFKLPSAPIMEFNFESTKHVGEEFYVNVSVMCTKDIQEEKSRTIDDVTITMSVTHSNKTWTIEGNSAGIDFSNWKGKVIAEKKIVKVENNVITFEPNAPSKDAAKEGLELRPSTSFRLKVGDYLIKPTKIYTTENRIGIKFTCPGYVNEEGEKLEDADPSKFKGEIRRAQ